MHLPRATPLPWPPLRPGSPARPDRDTYWSQPLEALQRQLGTGADGLSTEAAAVRLAAYGPNVLRVPQRLMWLRLATRQVANALTSLLLFAAVVALAMGEWLEAVIVLIIVIASAVIGFSREYGADKAAEALRRRIHGRSRVLRDGEWQPVPNEDVVPGDVVLLSAGSLVPADAVVIEATTLFVNQAALTGESFPVEKRPGTVAGPTALAHRTNCVFHGSHVRSGTGRCLVVHTGRRTEYGAVAARLAQRSPETEFERGLRRFGYLLMTAMFALIIVVFAAHVLRGRPAAETLLFSIALAVGLNPELLPAILSVNLARGARQMERGGVLVRRLAAIENLGSMDVLCTDKTGTLTEGVCRVEGAYDSDGRPADDVLALAASNATAQTGVANPLDQAIEEAHAGPLPLIDKLTEIPFDFERRRMSVVFRTSRGARIVCKGAFHEVLSVCTARGNGIPLDAATRDALTVMFDRWSASGLRVLAVATRDVDGGRSVFSRDDEREMILIGFVTFLDRPKDGVSEALRDLAGRGVQVKMVTGDSAPVARHVGGLIGLDGGRLLTGRELAALHGPALWHAVERTSIFAEVDPSGKERIVLALKKRGHVVGFLGDGINDAPAMHAADTSLSVVDAVDVAREAADFVLLERGLDVIRRGIEEGRRTFANTLKYLLTTMSANLGNMVSMAGASLVLPFLPLLPGQILLNNFLSDIPAVGLASDRVDEELVARPRHWDVGFIARFMLVFGLLSSGFDFLLFGVLYVGLTVTPAEFNTAWFIQSLLTELGVALVVRTQRPLFRSRPGGVLLVSTLVLVAVTPLLPLLPHATLLGFVRLPAAAGLAIVLVTGAYLASAEAVKGVFYRRRRGGDSMSPA